jgi:hypothetical protein
MTIEEKDVNSLCNSLGQKVEEGDKWLAFSNADGHNELFFFKDIYEAHKFCVSKSDSLSPYQFAPIMNVIRDLTGASATKNYFTKDLTDYYEDGEVVSVDPKADLTALLSNGNYHPVNYFREFYPCDSMDNFIIIERDKTPNAETGTFNKYHESFETYDEAVNAYMPYKEMRFAHTNVGVDLKIVGQLQGLHLQLNSDGEPVEGSGLVCLRGEILFINGGQKSYMHTTHMGPDWLPRTLKQPMMAKINGTNQRLEFFNGKLEKVDPNSNLYLMNFDYLSKESVKVGVTEIQSKNVVSESKKLHRRFKPDL